MSIRSWLYPIGKLMGDCNAVRKGRIGQRLTQAQGRFTRVDEGQPGRGVWD